MSDNAYCSLDAPENCDGFYYLDVRYWDSNVILGAVAGNPGGEYEVWAKGKDFAEAVMHAIRFIEDKEHHVVQVTSIP